MKKIGFEYNKSLSARIRRRNASGFNGEGTPSKWVKTSPFGDWQNQPTRKADKAREIGKNGNRTLNHARRKSTRLEMEHLAEVSKMIEKHR